MQAVVEFGRRKGFARELDISRLVIHQQDLHGTAERLRHG
jgi:hypothetical protein